MGSWTLQDRGRALVVHQDEQGSVTLTVADDTVLERTGGPLDTLRAELGEVDDVSQSVRIELGLTGRVRQAVLVESRAGMRTLTHFRPPAGTRARRLYDLREAKPRVYAARHVAATLLGFLGLGALISAFFARFVPRIDWSWLPTFALPEFSPPEWLRYLNPAYWLAAPLAWLQELLPDWDLFGWLPDWDASVLKPVIAVLVAVGIGWREVRRRETRAKREAQFERTADRPTDRPTEVGSDPEGDSTARQSGSDPEAQPHAHG